MQRIKEAFERNRKALELRPSVGQGTAVTKVTHTGGLGCAVEEGKWKFTVDASPKSGGGDEGPNPGIIGRAALGTCLAQAYATWAAVLGVPIDAMEVVIEADYDARGLHGDESVPVTYSEVRYNVTIASTAPDEEVMAMMEKAELHCPYLHNFAKPLKLRRNIELVAAGGR
jgi:uncharacterized OsmC-like protein